VLRVADRLGLDPAEVTRAVADAVSRDGDALGRLERRDRRADLDRGHGASGPAAAVRLARAGYPNALQGSGASRRQSPDAGLSVLDRASGDTRRTAVSRRI